VSRQLVAAVEYIFGVLDALGIRNGSIHNEIKIEDRGPGMRRIAPPGDRSRLWWRVAWSASTSAFFNVTPVCMSSRGRAQC
jgi:hypothetical protein